MGLGGEQADAEPAARLRVDVLIAVPDGLGMAEAVALLADGRTAMLLVRSVQLEQGETVLVEAAGGGVGSLLVQLARDAGASVVAAAGEDRKLTLARELGAEATVNYRDAGWVERVRSEVAGGVDAAFDGVGGEIGRASFGLVRDGGRFVSFGMASGAFAAISEEDATRRGVTVVHLPRPTSEVSIGVMLSVLRSTRPEELRANACHAESLGIDAVFVGDPQRRFDRSVGEFRLGPGRLLREVRRRMTHAPPPLSSGGRSSSTGRPLM